MSDKVAVMNQGRIEQFGTPEEVYLRPATRVRRRISRRHQLVRQSGRAARIHARVAREAGRRALPPGGGRELAVPRQLRPRERDAGRRRPRHRRSCRASRTIFAEGEAVWIHWDPADELRFE